MKIIKPDWDQYFLGLAFVTSFRSKDEQTQHGSVIVDRENHILSTGYNGSLSNVDDSLIPTTRPEKYPWMIHSEENAILNLNYGKPKRIYITGRPCNNCLMRCLQKGIDEFIVANRKGWAKENQDTVDMFWKIWHLKPFDLRVIDFDYESLISNLRSLELHAKI